MSYITPQLQNSLALINAPHLTSLQLLSQIPWACLREIVCLLIHALEPRLLGWMSFKHNIYAQSNAVERGRQTNRTRYNYLP